MAKKASQKQSLKMPPRIQKMDTKGTNQKQKDSGSGEYKSRGSSKGGK